MKRVKRVKWRELRELSEENLVKRELYQCILHSISFKSSAEDNYPQGYEA